MSRRITYREIDHSYCRGSGTGFAIARKHPTYCSMNQINRKLVFRHSLGEGAVELANRPQHRANIKRPFQWRLCVMEITPKHKRGDRGSMKTRLYWVLCRQIIGV